MNWRLMYETYLQQNLEDIPFLYKEQISTKPEYKHLSYEQFIFTCGKAFEFHYKFEELAFIREYNSFLINQHPTYLVGMLEALNNKISSQNYQDNVKEAIINREKLKIKL